MTERKRYYVVHDRLTPDSLEMNGTDAEEVRACMSLGPYPVRTWTISTDPNEAGWDTDNAYQSDGGLTEEEALWLANAANEKLDREGRLDDDRAR